MTVEVALVVSVVSVAFSIFFGLKNSRRTDIKDVEERVKENTRINMKLDEIILSIKEDRAEVGEVKQEVRTHHDRIIKVEESAKQAHHRIDTLESRMNGGN